MNTFINIVKNMFCVSSESMKRLTTPTLVHLFIHNENLSEMAGRELQRRMDTFPQKE